MAKRIALVLAGALLTSTALPLLDVSDGEEGTMVLIRPDHAYAQEEDGDGDSDSDGDDGDGDDGGDNDSGGDNDNGGDADSDNDNGDTGGNARGGRGGSVSENRSDGPVVGKLERARPTGEPLIPRIQRWLESRRLEPAADPVPPGRIVANPNLGRTGQQPSQPSPVALPDFAPRELTAFGLDDAAIDGLEADGYGVAERTSIAVLGGDIVRLSVPAGVDLADAREAVQTAAADAVIDFNHYYRTEQAEACEGLHCPATDLVDWDYAGAVCAAPARIGLIDTGINPDHSSFEDGSVRILDRFGGEEAPSGLVHGTAVAALLVGSAESRAAGLLPGAELVAVDAFLRAGADTRATAFDLVRAIDLLAAEDIAVLNMSLAGSANALLEQAVNAAIERSIIVVAAAGNEGPAADPVYPAAYEEVVAVTAVDRDLRPYRRAGRGAHIDIAAPGVEVWTAASISGNKPKTGTSFAAPFVTAATAVAKSADPALTAGDIEQLLSQTAADIGDPGKDPIFGWGLLDADALCETVEASLEEPVNDQAALPAAGATVSQSADAGIDAFIVGGVGQGFRPAGESVSDDQGAQRIVEGPVTASEPAGYGYATRFR